MNFFGHATVALWDGDASAFVFGAMLPDFAGMVGARIDGESAHVDLQRGISLHHRTDDAFHGAPLFVEQCAAAMTALTDAGLSRGSARAVGHVGTELLLDGWLASNDNARLAYRDALQAGPHLIDQVAYREADARARFAYLLSRLANAPIPERYADADFVTERLAFILASRPRLALQARDIDVVRDYLSRAQQRVVEVAPALIDYVRSSVTRPTDAP